MSPINKSVASMLGAAAVIVAASLASHAADEAAPAAPDPADVFARVDKNGDRKLKGEELPANWLTLFDEDGDGEISRKEFLGLMRRPPLLRRLHPLRDARPRAANALRQFDRDKNGLVSEEEYPGDRHVFKGADRNRSGDLDLEELVRLADDELDDIKRRMKSPGRRDFLVLFDINGDRNVTADEYDGPMRSFRKYDTDGDGAVTYGELYPDEAMRMMEYAEENKPKPEDINVLQSMDTDGDRKVSREEFKGTAAAWRRLDRNRDGWITATDAQ